MRLALQMLRTIVIPTADCNNKKTIESFLIFNITPKLNVQMSNQSKIKLLGQYQQELTNLYY